MHKIVLQLTVDKSHDETTNFATQIATIISQDPDSVSIGVLIECDAEDESEQSILD